MKIFTNIKGIKIRKIFTVLCFICVTQMGLSQFTITSSAGPNGGISPTGSLGGITSGTNVEYTFIPNGGYHIADVIVDGTLSVLSSVVSNKYTFVNVNANHSIAVSFANTYAITSFAGSNGSITPNGITDVLDGGSQSYTIAPSTGYHIADVLVDGLSAGAVASYPFTSVSAIHTISATFAINTYAIDVSSV